ncbi:hypothetical protein [Amycolatopsis albispora]|uniref:Uncharacterized protein n=1 Tax=Amycolatopsis albispora TaxID=1804986 RepID=A0A344L1P1_9PSEU|nr:hypothetical protein [Amycolatopsis albispora]AXB41965.1 hypothetical protein A4R43_05010 [Amycolatopsis albispora]
MAEQENEKTQPAEPTSRQLAAAREFLAKHGGEGKTGKAVVENVGRAGARVMLVGADGAIGDVFVTSVETGEKLVEAVDGLEPSTWDNETVGATKIGAKYRRRMASPR